MCRPISLPHGNCSSPFVPMKLDTICQNVGSPCREYTVSFNKSTFFPINNASSNWIYLQNQIDSINNKQSTRQIRQSTTQKRMLYYSVIIHSFTLLVLSSLSLLFFFFVCAANLRTSDISLEWRVITSRDDHISMDPLYYTVFFSGKRILPFMWSLAQRTRY